MKCEMCNGVGRVEHYDGSMCECPRCYEEGDIMRVHEGSHKVEKLVALKSNVCSLLEGLNWLLLTSEKEEKDLDRLSLSAVSEMGRADEAVRKVDELTEKLKNTRLCLYVTLGLSMLAFVAFAAILAAP